MTTAYVILFSAVAALAAHYGLLPWLVRRTWRAPRVRETSRPDALGLAFDEVEIRTVGGKRLYGWWIPADAGAPTVVLLHGWGGNAESLLPVAELLRGAGIACLLVDARNHGHSEADEFSSMVKFAEDLDHALAWVKAQPGTDASRVGVVGHSVGAAAALLCASRRDDLAAVVSIASFAHPRELMASMMAQRGIPYFPLGWWMLRHIERVIGASYDAIAPINTIGRISAPVLLLHGVDDRRVPVVDAHAIHARRAGDRTRLMLVPGGHAAAAALRHHGVALVAFLQQHCDLTAENSRPRDAAPRERSESPL
jgi:dipeptidyl aminopeptidase/acylaminoacyl peptidase